MKLRKDVFRLAIPIFTEQFFVIAMGMINTMMAGRISNEAVSGIGIVDSVNNIFIAFFTALAVGGTVVVAQFIGMENMKRANDAAKQALIAGLAISVGVTLLLLIFKTPIMNSLLGEAEELVANNAHVYFNITLLTYPFITLSLIANGVLRGAGDTKTPMRITIIMNIINVIATYLAINIFNWGIVGAALGIAIARIIGAGMVLLVLLKGARRIQLTNIKEFQFDRQVLKPIFGVGIPASIESLLFNSGKLITQVFIVQMGTVALTANTIGFSVANMLNIPGTALSTAAIALVGQYMGKKEDKEAEDVLAYITKMSMLFMTILGLSAIPTYNLIVGWFTDDLTIIELAKNILIMNSIGIIIWPLAFVLPAGLKGAGDVKYTLFTSIVGMWIFRITFGYILGVIVGLGLPGVWLAMIMDWLVRGTLYVVRFKKGTWKKKVVIQDLN